MGSGLGVVGKTVVITGGASGIGLGIARNAAAAGARLVIGDIEAPALDAAVAELSAQGADVHGVVTDVSKATDVERLAAEALERFGAVHVVCNNAGVGGGGALAEVPLEEWSWILGVNLWGVIHGIKTFLPLLLEQNEGHIVNTASVAGLTAYPGMGPYNATKHAVVAISETLFHELDQSGTDVGVSVLCPGLVNTNILDSARNRPEALQTPLIAPEPTEAEAAGREMVRAIYDDALDPAVVGAQVLDAVQQARFWIETDAVFRDAIALRCASVMSRDNPSLRGHLIEEHMRSQNG